MAIQVNQEFPHCERCGIMLHERQRRIVAGSGRAQIVYCSEICRDEHVEMHGLVDRGIWMSGGSSGIGRRR